MAITLERKVCDSSARETSGAWPISAYGATVSVKEEPTTWLWLEWIRFKISIYVHFVWWRSQRAGQRWSLDLVQGEVATVDDSALRQKWVDLWSSSLFPAQIMDEFIELEPLGKRTVRRRSNNKITVVLPLQTTQISNHLNLWSVYQTTFITLVYLISIVVE